MHKIQSNVDSFRGHSQPSARVVGAWLVLALQVQQTTLSLAPACPNLTVLVISARPNLSLPP